MKILNKNYINGSWVDWNGDMADVHEAATGDVIAEAGKKVTPRAVKKLIDAGEVTDLLVPFEHIVGKFVAKDIINEENGAIYVEAGDELTLEYDKDGDLIGGTAKELIDAGITEIPVLDIDNINVGPYMRNTMAQDKNMNRETALMDIYRVMRPGEPPTVEAASNLFDTLFFDSERYDLSAVGRVKMNMRLDLDAEDTQRTLRKEDIVACIKALVELRDGIRAFRSLIASEPAPDGDPAAQKDDQSGQRRNLRRRTFERAEKHCEQKHADKCEERPPGGPKRNSPKSRKRSVDQAFGARNAV